jgi:serine/threonine-protein kinase
MSPERILGSPPDGRSDVFSLGVVLHQLASGHHPFLKDTLSETMAAILRDQPASTEGDLDVVPGFGRLVHRMLA